MVSTRSPRGLCIVPSRLGIYLVSRIAIVGSVTQKEGVWCHVGAAHARGLAAVSLVPGHRLAHFLALWRGLWGASLGGTRTQGGSHALGTYTGPAFRQGGAKISFQGDFSQEPAVALDGHSGSCTIGHLQISGVRRLPRSKE
jgi:hypothetical protein